MGTEPPARTASLRGERRSAITLRRAATRAPGSPRLSATMRDLEHLARAGVHIGIQVTDVETGHSVLSGDAHVPIPIGAVGILPLLLEVTTRMHEGDLDPQQFVSRADDDVAGSGLWRHLETAELPLADVTALAAASADRVASNALLDLVGTESVTRRMASLGMTRSAILDRFRDERGPDDAPHAAIGSAREYAALFARIARREGISDAVADHLTALLAMQRDVSLVGASMAVDPFPVGREDDIILVNQVGRAPGMRAESGVAFGRRRSLAYALFVEMHDDVLLTRHRVHRAFRTLGEDILEIIG